MLYRNILAGYTFRLFPQQEVVVSYNSLHACGEPALTIPDLVNTGARTATPR